MAIEAYQVQQVESTALTVMSGETAVSMPPSGLVNKAKSMASKLEGYLAYQKDIAALRVRAGETAVNRLPTGLINGAKPLALRRAGFTNVDRGAKLEGNSHLTGYDPTFLAIGEGTYINRNVTFIFEERITLGREVSVAPDVRFITVTHEINMGDDGSRAGDPVHKPIDVGDNTWIGAGSIIGPGVNIGRGAVIGMGSIVLKDVPDNAIVAGNPARMLGNIEGGQKILFPEPQKLK